MKKILFIILALCYVVVAKAQSTDQLSAILQHGDEVSVYQGNTGFQKAYEAAADGDVIVLSQGTFQTVTRIEKAITILGAGFEENAEANTAITAFNSNVSVGKSDAVLDGFRMEGVKVSGTLQFDYEVKNVNIVKCYVTGDVRFQKNLEAVTLKQCRLGSSVLGANTSVVAKGLLVVNCHVNGNARNFSYESSANIDHCYIMQYGSGDIVQILVTNTIIEDNQFSKESGIAPYSTARNCIVTNGAGRFPATASSFNCHWVDRAAIFADAENGNYTETRTFVLQDPTTYVGTDGTPIGPSGGAGWNKVPSRPSISNLTATPSGTTLNVTYDVNMK